MDCISLCGRRTKMGQSRDARTLTGWALHSRVRLNYCTNEYKYCGMAYPLVSRVTAEDAVVLTFIRLSRLVIHAWMPSTTRSTISWMRSSVNSSPAK